ncbi:D-alanine--D-alanine ligase family protein [Rathayibacter soli]|uniref:D-alanine--D-alanine ligase family protein n=1 Tax=Rathayibacter soli TaxID=3144168 RepID=UPI0027E40762|nr:D-alanine--D-alanine ligase [Glaciibacter superstes]
MTKPLGVAVLFGGTSEERDVSIASAREVVRALRERGHNVLAVDTTRGVLSAADERSVLDAQVRRRPPSGAELERMSNPSAALVLPAQLAGNDIDVVFLALHGGSGEDGRIQSLLELAGILYTGAGPLGSALAMDKDVSKRLFREAGIPTPDWRMVPTDAAPRDAAGEEPMQLFVDEVVVDFGLPIVVKPNAQGSTVGLSLVRETEGFARAVAVASVIGEVMFERFVPGRELTVGVLDGAALAVGEVAIPRDSVFGYVEKYQAGAVVEKFPAAVPAVVAARARELAASAHRTLKLDGYSRADFRLDAAGELWLLEVNTLPGLTATSLLPQSGAAAGIEFGLLCERICELGIRRAIH